MSIFDFKSPPEVKGSFPFYRVHAIVLSIARSMPDPSSKLELVSGGDFQGETRQSLDRIPQENMHFI